MRVGSRRTRHVGALVLKSGPTQSGGAVVPGPVVGGEMLPVDKLSVFLSNYWLFVLLLFMLPFAFLFYKKREFALKLLTPLFSRIFQLMRI
ncbi:hypothetical protein MUP07_08165 [Candidatus Bathyarchaeota archaeon]|jgi:hypothetical protein|nr:hypothetical protein [Candidatus Bathyarchaeota archaeon]